MKWQVFAETFALMAGSLTALFISIWLAAKGISLMERRWGDTGAAIGSLGLFVLVASTLAAGVAAL
jgi:hypothetical protein